MKKTLALCPKCHYGFWQEVGCPRCEPKVAEKKPEISQVQNSQPKPLPKPKPKKIPMPSIEIMVAELGTLPNAFELVKMVRAGYSPHYIKSVLGMGYAKKAQTIRDRYIIS